MICFTMYHLTRFMLGKMAIDCLNMSADDSIVILFPCCFLKIMELRLGISLELHCYDAILMKFHDIFELCPSMSADDKTTVQLILFPSCFCFEKYWNCLGISFELHRLQCNSDEIHDIFEGYFHP